MWLLGHFISLGFPRALRAGEYSMSCLQGSTGLILHGRRRHYRDLRIALSLFEDPQKKQEGVESNRNQCLCAYGLPLCFEMGPELI